MFVWCGVDELPHTQALAAAPGSHCGPACFGQRMALWQLPAALCSHGPYEGPGLELQADDLAALPTPVVLTQCFVLLYVVYEFLNLGVKPRTAGRLAARVREVKCIQNGDVLCVVWQAQKIVLPCVCRTSLGNARQPPAAGLVS